MTPESIPTIVLAPAPEISETGTEVTSVDFKPRRKRGPQSKITQLPGHQRSLINRLLDDDKTYEEIVEEMAKLGVQLNTDNLSKWYTGPYQEYLAALDWRDDLQQLRDHAFTFGEGEANVRFQEGLVQIGLTQIFRAIKEDRFKDDPTNALRLFNSLARLSREALVIRKYADQQSKEKAQELRKLDPNRKINAAEETAMQDKSDDFFGWKSADRIKREMAIASQVRTDSTPSLKVVPTPPAPASSPSPAAAAGLPVSPLPPAGDLGKKATHSNSEFKVESSTLDVQSSGSVPLAGSLPVRLGPHPPAAPPPVTRHPSPSTERCHECRSLLPPLLPSGERPSTHCNKCGTGLRPPGTLIEYCPKCRHVLPELKSDGTRPIPNCQNCNKPLPPPPS